MRRTTLTEFFLIRHGETDWNVEGRYQGQADPPLNERGRAQAQRVAEALREQRLDALYASDLRRAAETAEAIGRATGLPVRYDPRLREIDQGEWQGLLVTEIERRYPDLFRRWREAPLTVTPPGGESIAHLQQRVLAAVEDIAGRHPGQRVAIVAHKTPIAIIKCHYRGIPLERLWELIPPNAEWEVVTTNVRPRYIEKPELNRDYFNSSATLPYGLTVAEVERAVEAVYRFLHDVNQFLVGRDYDRLEDILLGNSFAGLLSEVIVREVARHSAALERNVHIGGYPDLLPAGMYEGNSVLRGAEGIEVKSSKQRGGWQGHNPEAGWLMVFRYTVDTETQPVRERAPTQFVQILAARLELNDWSFSGRAGHSRRTITASIIKSGMHKLRSNPVYQHPDHVVKPHLYRLTR